MGWTGKTKRFKITIEAYAQTAFFNLALTPKRGRPWRNRLSVLNDILWVLRTGAPWANLPERYPFVPLPRLVLPTFAFFWLDEVGRGDPRASGAMGSN